MIITHLFAAASMFLSQFAPPTWLSAMSITTIIAMGLQVMNIISICNFLFLKFEIATQDTAKGAKMDKEFYEFEIWLTIELVAFVGGIIAHIIFLLIRS